MAFAARPYGRCLLALLPFALAAQVFNSPTVIASVKEIGIARPPITAADTLAKLAIVQARVATARAGLQICLPLRTMRLTSSFGWRVHPVTGGADFHRGIDLSARSEPVYSVFAGQVTATGYDSLLGNFIRIDHSGVQTIYGHLSAILISRGQVVTAGQVVGITGRSGRTTGEHLHFSIKFRGSYIHPLDFLSQAAGTPLLQ